MIAGGRAGARKDNRKPEPQRGLVDIDTGRVTRGRILVQRSAAGTVVIGFGGEDRLARFAFDDDGDPHPFFAACRRIVASLDARKIAKAQRLGVLSEIADPADPALTRLAVAEALIRAGFNPNEPRDENGRWTDEDGDGGNEENGGGGDGGISLDTAFGIAGFSSSGFAFADASAEAIASLSALGESFAAPVAFLGTLFFPTATGQVVEGEVPDHPDVHYRYDSDTGRLTLFSNGDAVYDDHVGGDGLFRDSEGRVIGRLVNGSVVLDEDAVAGNQAHGPTADDKPRLCPAPSPDQPGGMKEPARAYQAYIGVLINGFALPDGLAVGLWNPVEAKDVKFDNCRLSDGTMIEAKGPGYLKFLRDPKKFIWEKKVVPEFLDQAQRQMQAAQGRPIEWHFAEERVADEVRKLFADRNWPITVIYSPMPETKP